MLYLNNIHPEHLKFAIGILKSFEKDVANTWAFD
jgi:hypothetical protein